MLFLEKLAAIANELDEAGMNKEADMADRLCKLAQEELDDSVGWGPYDSMEDVDEAGEVSYVDPEFEEAGYGDTSKDNASAKIEEILSGIQALKDMGPDLGDPEMLTMLEEQAESLKELYLGGGSGESDPLAWGGSAELGSGGLSSNVLEVAQARRKRRRSLFSK